MLHKNFGPDDNHVAHAWAYADETARLAATGFVASDVGKWAWQLFDDTFWCLTNHSPITWKAVAGTQGPQGPAGPAVDSALISLSELVSQSLVTNGIETTSSAVAKVGSTWIYVASGTSTTTCIFTSPNGRNPVARTSAGATALTAITSHGNVAIAVGTNVCETSSNEGVTWVSRTIPAGNWVEVVSNGSAILAFASNGAVAKSLDAGVSWTLVTSSGVSINTGGVVYCSASSSFIIVDGSTPAIKTSSDLGTTWVARTVPAGFGSFNGYIGYDPNLNELLASDDGSATIKSTDGGATWISVTLSNSASSGFVVRYDTVAKVWISSAGSSSVGFYTAVTIDGQWLPSEPNFHLSANTAFFWDSTTCGLISASMFTVSAKYRGVVITNPTRDIAINVGDIVDYQLTNATVLDFHLKTATAQTYEIEKYFKDNATNPSELIFLLINGLTYTGFNTLARFNKSNLTGPSGFYNSYTAHLVGLASDNNVTTTVTTDTENKTAISYGMSRYAADRYNIDYASRSSNTTLVQTSLGKLYGNGAPLTGLSGSVRVRRVR